jgi:hypothetical protein
VGFTKLKVITMMNEPRRSFAYDFCPSPRLPCASREMTDSRLASILTHALGLCSTAISTWSVCYPRGGSFKGVPTETQRASAVRSLAYAACTRSRALVSNALSSQQAKPWQMEASDSK